MAMSVLLIMTMLPAGVFAEAAGKTALADDHVHTMEYVAAVEATCQNSGMQAHYHCTTCDKLFTDAEGTKEVTDSQTLIIPILEHTWDEGVVEKEAKPGEPGRVKYTCKVCGVTMTEDVDYVSPREIPDAVKKSFTLDGNKLKFKQKVVSVVQDFMTEANISHTWIKAKKSKIVLYWDTPREESNFIDGIIIMRKTGKEKAYSELTKLQFRKTVGGVSEWSPKTSYTDKTAKKKNTPYTYVILPYYEEDDFIYIGHCSEWAAGQTTASKLKNAYTGKLNKKSLELQYKGKDTLTLTIKNAKKMYGSKLVRWLSDDKEVAKVNKKGKVTATGVGSTIVRGRLASGKDVSCKVSVVGAFKPDTSKLKVDIATASSISLLWSKAKNATSYDLYQSNDGVKWKKPIRVKGTSKKVKGLKKGHKYYFYVQPRNDNNGYTALGHTSNMVSQKAVLKRRETKMSGFVRSKTLTAGSTFILPIKILSPDGRKASLQQYVNKKWVTQKTIILPKGAGKVTVKIQFPNTWWKEKTGWRLMIPQSNTSDGFISKTLIITPERRYQNPKGYVQFVNEIDKHKYTFYASKVLTDNTSQRTDHVEAFIKTANAYKGTFYAAGKANAPGQGIDDAGLVMQACYGAGADIWPMSPVTRSQSSAEDMWKSSKFRTITTAEPASDTNYPGVYRGDLIFFNTSKNHVGHVAIYLGLGKIIHASQVSGKVGVTTISHLTDKKGNYKYTVAGARRVFIS